MRVLLLSDRIPPENRGGAGKVAWALALGLRRAGHSVQVIAATPDAAFEEERDGIPTLHLHSRYPSRWQAWLSLYNLQTARPLWQAFARFQPDVIHAHNIHLDLSYHALRIAHEMGVPTVFTAHDLMTVAYARLTHFIDPADPARCAVEPSAYTLPPLYNARQMRLRYNPLRNPIIRGVLRRVDARIALSRAQQAALEANGLLPFEIVYNGIDPHDFEPPAPVLIEALRDRLGLRGHPVILFGGRLSDDKGSFQLMAALDRVVQTIPNARLLVLSAAPFEPRWLAGCAHLTRDHVREGGWLSGDDLRAAYALADVIAAPSICLDVFPTITLEAMAASKPVIATCFGGSPDAVIDGETGYVINPFDTAAFADRLARLLGDASLRERMGAAGRARLLDRFTLERHVRDIEQVYGRIRVNPRNG